jgi:hypothetical protein
VDQQPLFLCWLPAQNKQAGECNDAIKPACQYRNELGFVNEGF